MEVVAPYSTGMDVTGHTVDELFPKVDPQFEPFGARVMVQLRRVVNMSKGGIALISETKATEAWNIQVAKLIKVGPLAFKNRATSEPWPEGVWADIGDFVMVPRWGGDRRSIPAEDGGEPVVVLVCNDSDLIGQYTGDPLAVKAFIA